MVPFYDTAGSVKHLMAAGLRDVAGIAPELAADCIWCRSSGGGSEDHDANYTRFHLIRRPDAAPPMKADGARNKMSLAFADRAPAGDAGGCAERLLGGVDLTKIESRPVPGSPWEYVFYVDVRFDTPGKAEVAVAALMEHCRMVKVLGTYTARLERGPLPSPILFLEAICFVYVARYRQSKVLIPNRLKYKNIDSSKV